jgi:hypothetical protein
MRRRPKLHGTVEYLIVLQEDAKKRLGAEGNEHMDDSNCTAQEVLNDHLNPSEHWGAERASSRPREEQRDG